ncbi:MAG: hypothetical protein DI530_15090 [Sphingomonas sp.]|nr:MAG: hypothetical protein DI530_15090 [Sphingomonas sp.]
MRSRMRKPHEVANLLQKQSVASSEAAIIVDRDPFDIRIGWVARYVVEFLETSSHRLPIRNRLDKGDWALTQCIQHHSAHSVATAHLPTDLLICSHPFSANGIDNLAKQGCFEIVERKLVMRQGLIRYQS